ncbi:hypothetical protein ACFWBR_03965 [Streptomyces sp. NPDC060006]|uniref:hypothetical protein n=1 Tax=unclassified Streptomyces TaxID=2593676 RepID=UPI0036307F3E
MWISTLLRRINNAARAEDIAVTRQLCQEAEREADGCQGLVLYEVQSTLERVQAWLAAQDRIRRVLFARLKEAEQARNAIAVGSHLKQLKTLLARGEEPTEAESAILRAAEDLVTAKDRETEARRRQSMTEHQADTTRPYSRAQAAAPDGSAGPKSDEAAEACPQSVCAEGTALDCRAGR